MTVMILTTAMLASLSFVLAAYCSERGLKELGLPMRAPWVVALASSALVPLAPFLLTVFSSSPSATSASSAQGLPVINVLTASVLGRLYSATAAGLGPWLIALCACAILIALVRLILSTRRLGRLARDWKRADVAGVRVLISQSYGPAIKGLTHPEIVIPRRIADLPLDEQRLALTHELEHIAARDQWLDRGAAIAVALSAWNPFVWLAARRLRSAIELDCDARVLRRLPNVSVYASLLINVASWPRESATAALALGETVASQLDRRLQFITADRRSRRLAPALLMLGAAVGLGLVACDVAVTVERPTPPELRQLDPVVTTASASQNIFLESQVDRPVTMSLASAAPRYPDVLRRAGVAGEVLVQFVVEADGRVDIATFKTLKTSHDLFTQTVFDALPDMRFVPAEVRGERVRQLVQQPFAFAIAR